MDSGGVVPGFLAVAHYVQGQLVVPFISHHYHYRMLTVIIYDKKGKLINIEISGIPEGTEIPE